MNFIENNFLLKNDKKKNQWCNFNQLFNYRNDSRNKSKNHTTMCSDSYIIIALTEGVGKARGEVGLAAFDLNNPHLILSQICDNMWYSEIINMLAILNPSLILIPNSWETQNYETKIITIIKQVFPEIHIISILRRYFDSNKAKDIIKELCCPADTEILLIISEKYYTLSAAAALLFYLEEVKSIKFASKSLKIIYKPQYGTMMIDVESSHCLELVNSIYPTREEKSSLYGILNYCVTNIGQRALRAKILQPTCDISTIKSIQKCVNELIEKDEILVTLNMILKSFYNVDKLLKLSIIVKQDDSLKASEIMINQILLLKTILQNVDSLKNIINQLETDFFIEINETLNDKRYNYILKKINEILNTDSKTSRGTLQYFQRIYAVKSNINELLDITRKDYSNKIDRIHDLTKELQNKYNLPLKLNHTISRGFHFHLTNIPNEMILEIKKNFEIIHKKGKDLYLTTNEILEENRNIRIVVNEIHKLSNKIISDLLNTIRVEIDVIYYLTGTVTELDIIQSFAYVAKSSDFTCPEFGDSTEIEDGIHPLLESNKRNNNIVPNKIICSPEYNFFILTGPNMSGKSIYIKMIAILQILAQIGSFVPAKSAKFRICDKLFTRMGFSDNIEQGYSSFGVELKEMEYILKNITPNSLVLIDELFRSTNAEEGKLLAWKICENFINMAGLANDGKMYNESIKKDSTKDDTTNSIINKSKIKFKDITTPFIYIVTHFIELTKLSELYFNVINIHLPCLIESDENFRYKIQEGPTISKDYGLKLTKLANIYKSIVTDAENIKKTLKIPISINLNFNETFINKTNQNSTVDLQKKINLERIFYDFYSIIATTVRKNNILKNNEIDESIRKFLNEQNNEFIEIIKNENPEQFITSYIENLSKLRISKDNTCDEITNYSNLSMHSLLRRIHLKQNDKPIGNDALNEIELDDDEICSVISLETQNNSKYFDNESINQSLQKEIENNSSNIKDFRFNKSNDQILFNNTSHNKEFSQNSLCTEKISLYSLETTNNDDRFYNLSNEQSFTDSNFLKEKQKTINKYVEESYKNNLEQFKKPKIRKISQNDEISSSSSSLSTLSILSSENQKNDLLMLPLKKRYSRIKVPSISSSQTKFTFKKSQSKNDFFNENELK